MNENTNSIFHKNVVSVTLPDWMEWASGAAGSPRTVVLPMIQRGSVWAPHKLLDLWDTLLRGMPVGAFMASGTKVVADGKSMVVPLGNASTRQATATDISLIDGQQRTLSMLAGWPQGLQNPLRPVAIWVDLADDPQSEYQFRLWATTKAQPFGYSRASVGGQPLSKLERNKLRLANQAWGKMNVQELWGRPDFMPWDAKFALPLTELIDNQRKGTLHYFLLARLEIYVNALEAKIREIIGSQVSDENSAKVELQKDLVEYFTKRQKALPTEAQLAECIRALDVALNKVLTCEFPVIHVRQESFVDQAANSSDVNADPPLAILFKRVGTGGEPLSNADYVYSVIKHHSSKVHGMVEALLSDPKIQAIYTPTTLVMSAVRLTMLSYSKEQKVTDSAKLDKAAFARMVRNHVGFIDEFEKNIQPDGIFEASLKTVLESISYNETDFTTGFPKHALCLVQIPLLEVILAWRALKNPSIEILTASRLAMVRFILQGHLCISDYAKASEVAIKALREGVIAASHTFPDQGLMAELCKGEKATAYALPSPEQLKSIELKPLGRDAEGQEFDATWSLPETPDGTNGLRGWTRFVVQHEADKPYAEIYKRWWLSRKGNGHIHPMLLWLQRDYIYKKFEKQPALAGMDEETPYDFDHILSSAQWVCGTGNSGPNTFRSFPLKDADDKTVDNTGHWHIGNSLGNIHVLDSSENRSLGDTSVSIKLERNDIALNAQICASDKEKWLKASGEEGRPRHWNKERALAFQSAVERRIFSLYKKFYEELKCGGGSSVD